MGVMQSYDKPVTLNEIVAEYGCNKIAVYKAMRQLRKYNMVKQTGTIGREILWEVVVD